MRIRLPNGRRLIVIALTLLCVATLFVGLTFSRRKSAETPTLKVFRDTHALELVKMEVTTNGNLLVVFKNVSTRDINGFVLVISGGAEVTVDTSAGDRVIAPQATEDLEIPTSLEVPEITIRAVMFADGTVEGNETTVALVKQRRSALKRELKRGLQLLKEAAAFPDAESPAIFETLESAISNLQFDPSLRSQDTGLNEAKQALTTAISEVRTRQQRNGYAKQRERLTDLCNRIERRIASL
jgi:hypothetical protein